MHDKLRNASNGFGSVVFTRIVLILPIEMSFPLILVGETDAASCFDILMQLYAISLPLDAPSIFDNRAPTSPFRPSNDDPGQSDAIAIKRLAF
ncbi:hypothetical protein FP2506_13504 [Fulvimarina pelagi HTCC2506]|uniref:Uncharacterized protein n=1 Tax=Fulvimarina pelagi HTCC2506 TaxID=314231 RepID=Q0G4M9_9HYPH|nr:hypothetical protein FP2506_13504 [Fulvimarina pelagi HTCC2506]